MVTLLGMDILPGLGIDSARIGDLRSDVERRLGPPAHPGKHPRAVYGDDVIITYDQDDAVELVEIGYGEQVFFDGVELTLRFMDDVLAELAAKGHPGTPFDIGFAFEPGFAIFTMSSLDASQLDPSVPDGDERDIVEGVAIAPFSYFSYGPPADAPTDELEAWLREQGVPPPEQ